MKKALGILLLATAATAILGPLFLIYPAAYVVAVVAVSIVITLMIFAGINLING